MILFLLGGAITAFTMQTEVFPTLQPRTVQVAVIYPGATPGDVEDSITRRIEEAVIGLEGVDRVRSVASEGRGTVTVELQDFADAQVVKDDVETAVSAIADFPPPTPNNPRSGCPSRSPRSSPSRLPALWTKPPCARPAPGWNATCWRKTAFPPSGFAAFGRWRFPSPCPKTPCASTG